MLAKIAPQKSNDLMHGNRVPPITTSILFRDGSERDHAQSVSGWRIDVALRQERSGQLGRVLGVAAAESRQCNLQHVGVSCGGIEPSRAFFDLADDHVWAIGGTAERRIGLEGSRTHWWMRAATNHFMASAAEPYGEHIQVGDRARRTSARGLQHRVLDDREVSVDVQVGANERDGGVNGNPPLQRRISATRAPSVIKSDGWMTMACPASRPRSIALRVPSDGPGVTTVSAARPS